MAISHFRDRALASTARELNNTILLLTRHFDLQFQDIQAMQADVVRASADIRHHHAQGVPGCDCR